MVCNINLQLASHLENWINMWSTRIYRQGREEKESISMIIIQLIPWLLHGRSVVVVGKGVMSAAASAAYLIYNWQFFTTYLHWHRPGERVRPASIQPSCENRVLLEVFASGTLRETHASDFCHPCKVFWGLKCTFWIEEGRGRGVKATAGIGELHYFVARSPKFISCWFGAGVRF